MISFLRNFFRRNVYLILTGIVLFFAAYLINVYLSGTSTTRILRNSIQSFLQERESDFQHLLRDENEIRRLSDKNYSRAELDGLMDKQYGILIYERNHPFSEHLTFWSDQSSVLPDSVLLKADGDYFMSLSNGQFEIIKHSFNSRSTYPLTVIALIPVRWQYYISPENLPPEFVGFPSADNRVRISLTPTPFPVKNLSGETLFYLQKTESFHAAKYSLVLLLVIFIAVLILLVIVHNMAHAVAEEYSRIAGILFLTFTVLIIRTIIYNFPEILHLRQYELFDPTIYGSNFVLRSLGDLLINVMLFCWIVLFVRQEMGEYTFPLFKNSWKRWLMIVFTMGVLVVTTFLFADIVQSLVADARISFNVTNFFSLTIYSFVGFIILAALALSYFFFTQILLRLVRGFIEGNKLPVFILVASIGLGLLTFHSETTLVELDIYVLIWLLCYLWLMMRNLFSGLHYQMNVSEILFWLFIFSSSISVIIIFENQKIELEQRKSLADRLAEQIDPSSEKLVSMSLIYFNNDFLFREFDRFRNPVENHFLKDSLINNNFSAYLSKYDTKIYTYDSSEKPLYNQVPVSFDTLNTVFKLQGKPTTIPNLMYYEKSYDKFSYIYKKIIESDQGKTVGYLFVQVEPRSYKSDGLFPRLTQQRKEFLPEYSPIYSYAIYSNAELITYYNNYPFPTQLTDSLIPKKDFYQKKNNGYDELWHSISDDKIIVIAKKDNLFIEAVTLFSYLFSAFLILVALFWFSSVLIQTGLHWRKLKEFLQLNIRSQIHTTIIFVSLFLFLVIGVSTIFFLINRYNRNNQDRLSASLKVMAGEIESRLASYALKDPASNPILSMPHDELEKLINNTAEIHNAEINLYDLNGDLIISSTPFIYAKGILSEQMNPLAYFYMNRLNSIEFFNQEKMGGITFQSIYCPVRIDKGHTSAYLNIPSFNTEDELNDEISRFLVTIMNLNVFIFLIAGTIALFLTNRITSSFTLISEKMRQVNLSKTNEAIEWKKNDEIGVLIKEYNKMVDKLVDSASALAKSEREGAWREMARQVAHEIKNPLTPMKLSIQYLQKANNSDAGNMKDLTANVAKTLVEQIDHLSKIAADFSQFANIGNPKREIFDLHEMLSSLVSLYETLENLLFKWVPVREKVMVYADKTQLNRLFTNLLQNAFEACHEMARCVISVSEELREDHILIKISDNGEGIPEQMQSKIFMPNFTTKSSGTGLGLAMSKTIVEQARGRIWFETSVGNGTTFFVELPLDKG
ncbi:MAG: HAMP domain-containing sensor histidine kinase [Bacteroidota bacterium]|nr:HAMP domain-containing sensor histidine kinase [Bacteroidota bacterium]MDP4249967.1 HAMP domain-containing sensor histidine kinase [Bacteroidota bacterium]